MAHATKTQERPKYTQDELDAAFGRVIETAAAAFNVFLVALGDRNGLFRVLADGPRTAAALAKEAGADERHVREWAEALRAGGILAHDGATGRYSLPPAHVPLFADPSHPYFVAGGFQEAVGVLKAYDAHAKAFRAGGGVAYDDFDDDVSVGIERFTNCWFDHMLVPVWIESLPDVKAKLETGALVADVGCGGGRGLVALAKAFPKSRFVGVDVHGPSVERARRAVREAGVADRVEVVQADVAKAGLPGTYDLVTTFDVVHDAVDPRGLVAQIRRALRPDGAFLCLEIRSEDDPSRNTGPMANLLYGFSNFLCMQTSLAHGGAGLGTMGLPPARFRALCEDVGFGSVQLVESHSPFNHLYVAKQ